MKSTWVLSTVVGLVLGNTNAIADGIKREFTLTYQFTKAELKQFQGKEVLNKEVRKACLDLEAKKLDQLMKAGKVQGKLKHGSSACEVVMEVNPRQFKAAGTMVYEDTGIKIQAEMLQKCIANQEALKTQLQALVGAKNTDEMRKVINEIGNHLPINNPVQSSNEVD